MNKIERVKNDNYTVLSNIFIKDNNLSLKAKGLLCVIMGLPKSWNFSINGICAILKESKTAVYNTIDELKKCNYCKADNKHGEGEKFEGYDYTFYEEPYTSMKHKTRKRIFKSSCKKYIYNSNNLNYNNQLKSKEWKDFRKEVFKIKGKKCEICGSTNHLNIHHPFYTKGKLAWEYNPSDMMVLCHDCHKKIHNII